MIYQNLEEIRAALLINPDLELTTDMLGENLYLTEVNETNGAFDYHQVKIKDTHLRTVNIIELTTKNDVLNFLNHPHYYFDYDPAFKQFRTDA